MKTAGFATAIAMTVLLVAAIVATASAHTYEMTTPIAPGVATPNKLVTSIGTLNLSDGYSRPIPFR